MFRSSLPLNRVLEDPSGELPVLVCYKLNGQWLSPKRGGPVRMLVPEAYGFKSVKWLQRIVLTNNHQANDTYADANNDIESWQKTFARFVDAPEDVEPGAPIPLTGLAQVGIGGLTKVQVALDSSDAAPADDPYFTRLAWRAADVLPLPPDWSKALPEGKTPEMPLQFDPQTGRPREWPLRYTLVHRHDARRRDRKISTALSHDRSGRPRPATAAALSQIRAQRDSQCCLECRRRRLTSTRLAAFAALATGDHAPWRIFPRTVSVVSKS